MFDGALGPWAKTDTAFVWPVRGGKTRPYVLTVKKEGTGKGKITATDLSCTGLLAQVITIHTRRLSLLLNQLVDLFSPDGRIVLLLQEIRAR